MNRSDAAETKKTLAGLLDCNTIYKSLWPKQILNSELKVTKVTEVVVNEYINPFGLEEDKDSLVKISSGTFLPEEITDEVLNQLKKGKELAEEFIKAGCEIRVFERSDIVR